MTESVRLLPHFTGAIILFLIACAAPAEMYKWVDEEGVTHYTERPPPGDVEATTIKPPPRVDTGRALSEYEQQQQKLNELREGRQKSAEERKREEEIAAIQKSNCDLARDKLEKASGSTRLYGTDAQGNRVRLGEEERQARIAAAQKDIAEFCK